MKFFELKLRLIAPVVVVCCFVCLGLLFAAPASAQQGFEGPFPPSGWTFSGPPLLGGVANSTSGITPTEGLQYGWISTGCVGSAGTTCPTVATTGTPSYANLGLGLGTGLGTPTTETFLTSPTFTLVSSTQISFDVNFITTDGTNPFADFALVQLIPSTGSPVDLFVANTTGATSAAVPPVDLTAGVGTMSPATAFFSGATVMFGATTYGNVPKFGGGLGGPTGWIHVTYLAPAGTYTLKFFVSHVGDTNYPSALAIDNIAVTTQTQTVTLGGPGTTTTLTFNTDTYKITPTNNAGNEQLTVTAFLIPASAFPAGLLPSFPSERCIPYADYSAFAGMDTCVEFQATCVTATGPTCNFIYQLAISYDLPPDLSAIGGPDFLVAHGQPCPLTTASTVQSIFLSYTVARTDPTTVGGSEGPSCFDTTYTAGAPLITTGGVSSSQFVGWESPVDNNALNQVKAGSTRPLKFQYFDILGNPVTNLSLCNSFTGSLCTDSLAVSAPWVNLSSFGIACPNSVPINPLTDTTSLSSSNSVLLNNGGGNYQLNWQTQKSWQGFCANVVVTFNSGLVVTPAKIGFQFN